MWNKGSIEKLQQDRFGGRVLIVASSAEPYIHTYVGDDIKVTRSVGGVVTALEPILEATKGIWVAHGQGPADQAVVNEQGRIKVPPKHSSYTLRRLSISKKDLKGWYYNFSNETLWPLCHTVFERPVFNENDWRTYEKVNRHYAEAILQEIEGKQAIVWLQDYHLALAARYIREKRPDVFVSQFWHIPWPISTIFQICPWRKEILEGLLGNHLLGFQRNTYSHNFLDSVAKTLEAKVDFDAMTVTYKDHVTHVRAFPISIDYQSLSRSSKRSKSFGKTYLKKFIGTTKYDHVALGIERVDYIKGLPERIRAIDRFLEKYPDYQEHFVYLSILIPSRILIPRYEELNKEIEALIEHVNFKYQTPTWQPIHTIRRPMTTRELNSFYKSAHMTMVTSLADGMNLVAKEYVAAGPDDGVLILSNQAGAAKELTDAVLINPYDIERLADSIKNVLEMPKEDRMKRMARMREIVAKQNVYRWAGKFLLELLDLKI
jgi:trehalose-6-phosphate synthase